ncbi:MAG: DUF1007 family protein [Pseudomonadota bacterium]
MSGQNRAFLPKYLRGFSLGLLLVAAMPQATQAHPHAWIDITVDVQLNDKAEAVALEQTWLFDEYYTAFATEGMDSNGDGQPDPDKLAELLELNMSNLADYQYFTRVDGAGGSVGFDEVMEMASEMDGTRLRMTFVLPLDKPQALSGQSLRYAVFDPTYYIEMLHAEGPDVVTFSDPDANCRYTLTPATPDPETVSLAFALDQTESAGDGLGIHFAEWATLECD